MFLIAIFILSLAYTLALCKAAQDINFNGGWRNKTQPKAYRAGWRCHRHNSERLVPFAGKLRSCNAECKVKFLAPSLINRCAHRLGRLLAVRGTVS